jgi:hypothetical protein
MILNSKQRTRTYQIAAMMLSLVLLSMFSFSAAHAEGRIPPRVPNGNVVIPLTVGSWCKLTASSPSATNGNVVGNGTFFCKGQTYIKSFSSYIVRDARPDGSGIIAANSPQYGNFYAQANVTYIASARAYSCYNTTYTVHTSLTYADPNTNQDVSLHTNGSIITLSC